MRFKIIVRRKRLKQAEKKVKDDPEKGLKKVEYVL